MATATKRKKFTPNGSVVIFTDEGTKILGAEVRHFCNVHAEWYQFKFDEPEKYLLIGGARTVPTDNIHAARVRPESIIQAVNLTKTKFFRLMLDLMRLAQYDPIDKRNYFFESGYFRHDEYKTDIDFSTSVKELDAQFYRKYKFSPAMIKFVEEKYSYDDLQR